jgi:hypothetical protein
MWFNLLIILGTCVTGVVLGFFVSRIIINIQKKTLRANKTISLKGERHNLKIKAPPQDLARKGEGLYNTEITTDDSSPSYQSLQDIITVKPAEEPATKSHPLMDEITVRPVESPGLVSPQLIDEISIRPAEEPVTKSHPLMDEITVKPVESPGLVSPQLIDEISIRPAEEAVTKSHPLMDEITVRPVESPGLVSPQLIDEISIRPAEEAVTKSHPLMDEISIKPSPGPVHIEYEILDDLITKSAIYPTKKAKPSSDAVITTPVENPVEKAEPVKTISVNEITEILNEKRGFKQTPIPSVATELRITTFLAHVGEGIGNLFSQAKNLYKKTDTLSIILVIAILGAIVVLGYKIVVHEPEARFTEFFILGIGGKADDYPTEFTMDNGKVTQVKYGDATNETTAGDGLLTLGIVNHEQQTEVYSVEMIIDNEPASINFEGKGATVLSPIELQKGHNWEKVIGIIPQHTGDNQEVDLLLFKGKETTPEDSLRLFINVKEAE